MAPHQGQGDVVSFPSSGGRLARQHADELDGGLSHRELAHQLRGRKTTQTDENINGRTLSTTNTLTGDVTSEPSAWKCQNEQGSCQSPNGSRVGAPVTLGKRPWHWELDGGNKRHDALKPVLFNAGARKGRVSDHRL